MGFVLFDKNKGLLENIRLFLYLQVSLTQRFYLLVWSHNNRTIHPKPVRVCGSLLRFCNTLNIGAEQSVLCREVSSIQWFCNTLILNIGTEQSVLCKEVSSIQWFCNTLILYMGQNKVSFVGRCPFFAGSFSEVSLFESSVEQLCVGVCFRYFFNGTAKTLVIYGEFRYICRIFVFQTH